MRSTADAPRECKRDSTSSKQKSSRRCAAARRADYEPYRARRRGPHDHREVIHAPGVQLVALFSPEHGISGSADDKVSSSKDPTTGLPTYSLYGESLRPTDEMLSGIDTLVFDIQDAGVRFYTYTVTMAYAMEEAAKHHIAFYVLDRPNLLGGEIIEGPMLDPDKTNFVGYYPLPIGYALPLASSPSISTGKITSVAICTSSP